MRDRGSRCVYREVRVLSFRVHSLIITISDDDHDVNDSEDKVSETHDSKSMIIINAGKEIRETAGLTVQGKNTRMKKNKRQVSRETRKEEKEGERTSTRKSGNTGIIMTLNLAFG